MVMEPATIQMASIFRRIPTGSSPIPMRWWSRPALISEGGDHARIDLQDDIRSAWVFGGIVEFVDQRLPGKDFLNSQRLLIGRFAERCHHAGRERRIGQPDERAIVGNVESIGRADRCRRLAAANSNSFAD